MSINQTTDNAIIIRFDFEFEDGEVEFRTRFSGGVTRSSKESELERGLG